MTYESFPLSGENFTSAQWRDVFDGQHGIIGATGAADTCLDLALSEVDNIATLKKGRIWYRGFGLKVTVNQGITLAAAVDDPVAYSIGVMFDPALESTGPLALYSGLSTDVAGDTPAGGSFLLVYEVTREAAQILSQADVADQRRYLGPHASQPSGTAPTDATLGTRLWLNGEDLLRVRNGLGTGAVWQSLSDPPWTSLTLVTSGSNKTQASDTLGGPVPQVRMRYGRVEFRGEVERNPNSSGFPLEAPFKIGSVPTSSLRPAVLTVGTVACENGNYFNAVRVEVTTAGDVYVRTPAIPVSGGSFPHWVSLNGFSYPRKVS